MDPGGEGESAGEGGDEEDPWAEAFAEEFGEEGPPSGDDEGGDFDFGVGQMTGGGGNQAQPASMPDLEEDPGAGQGENAAVNLDMILDIPVTIAMEIGRTRINIRNLLQLNQGSVVELDRFAGEPLDVMVNGTLIAHGEVVVVNEKFGIRLTDVISAQERIKKLK
ncbi:MAG: flagellar motor switch protein FliN [Thiohalospira sp.]|uniref:flagellar motor switch protein FliN n=1 Tax=Thiohalospira sp. TaxID=3080549 RepID=UPI0039814CD9